MLPARVLMVDDDVLFARRARLAFGESVELRVARTRAEALAEVERWTPDLLVLDLFVSDSDAFRLLDDLRGHLLQPRVGVIYLTKGPGSSTRIQRAGGTDDSFLGVIQRESGVDSLRDAVLTATQGFDFSMAA